MDKLQDKLLKLKETLQKGMNNAGIGGPGSVKLGAVLPSIKRVTSAGKPAGNNSATPSTGIKQPSKKNPLKSAEQTQNKDIKDLKMKEAQAQMKAKAPEMIKFEKNGQWSLSKEDVTTISYDDSSDKVINGATVNEAAHRGADVNIGSKQPSEVHKSGYKGYTDTDNMKRKKNNLSEDTGIHSMNRIKRYGGSGPDAANREAAEMKRKSKKNPVKVYTKEEIAAYNANKK